MLTILVIVGIMTLFQEPGGNRIRIRLLIMTIE